MPDTTAIRRPARRPLQWLGKFILPLIGWRVEGRLPDIPKFILIVYPHTSNWDMVIGLICAHAIGLFAEFPYGFMVKDNAVKWPVIGWLVRRLGGIAINRRANFNAVDQMVEIFQQRQRLMLAITPEGTRKRTDHWKSGFYHIARAANVPVMLGYLDYKRRAGGLGPTITLSGEVEADLDVIRNFYARITPLYPHEAGEIRFKAEEPQR
ncbi:MAG: lysophospholipid acyltransferase family protein [Anaerolineales bacterium]